MNDLLYNIPLHLLPNYSEQHLIVRASEPAAVVAALPTPDPDHVVGVQLLALENESEVLNAWAPDMPIELVMTDPAREFSLLYRHTDLLDNHPVRVVIPVVPEFGKAVKVAVALECAVLLGIGQPEPTLIDEAMAVLEFALHQPTVAQPIEYFHSALLGFYHAEPAPLWMILDEDPSMLRHVTDAGVELLSQRLAGIQTILSPAAGLEEWLDQVLATAEECRTCEFRPHCGGYFKWPRPDYDCAGVKRLFGQLQAAALELRRDLDSAPV